MAENKVRLEMTVDGRTVERLKVLQEQSGAEHLKDVMKYALRLYEEVLKEETVGSIFYIKRTGKEIEPFSIFKVDKENLN